MPYVIFDIGMHNGNDSEFYLRKGFSVVAIEANPVLAEQARQKLGVWIDCGRLNILNVGLSGESGVLPFYVNKVIDEWSSFDHDIASRGHPVDMIEVQTITISDLVASYGVPYYAKIDIEGLDGLIVNGFINRENKPNYISYENPMPDIFEGLVDAGYKRFKCVSQSRVESYSLPNPPREGRYVDWVFKQGTSGPFGEETPGEWLGIDEMRPLVKRLEAERLDALKATIYPDWFDMHCSLS